MKYYADYMKERLYAVESDGTTIVKWIDGNSVEENTFKRDNDRPWLSEENGVGFYVEEMTGEEYETFGKKWVWNDSPISSFSEPYYKCYIKWL